jgi:hypothetical protein
MLIADKRRYVMRYPNMKKLPRSGRQKAEAAMIKALSCFLQQVPETTRR